MSKRKKTSEKISPEETSDKSRWEKIAESRTRDFSASELTSHVKIMDSLLDDLKGLAESMERYELDTVRVNGATQIERAAKELRDFLGNVTAAISKAKYQ